MPYSKAQIHTEVEKLRKVVKKFLIASPYFFLKKIDRI